MRDAIRTLLLGAVGALDLTEDKVRAAVDELVRRGEVAVDESRTILAEWRARSERRQTEEDERLAAAVDEALGRANAASHESVVELQQRVSALEAAMSRLTTAGEAHAGVLRTGD
jgi:polyhydroxyalkanoate synthesis regulator phasin